MPSWTLRRHCAGRGTDMAMITITQYADMHGPYRATASNPSVLFLTDFEV